MNSEEDIKNLNKKKKSELIDLILKSNLKQQEDIKKWSIKKKKLGNTILELNKHIQRLKLISEHDSQNFWNLKPLQKVYIESVTSRGRVRTYLGYVIKESSTHILICIKCDMGDYGYVVDKSTVFKIRKYNIKGMKIYSRDEK